MAFCSTVYTTAHVQSNYCIHRCCNSLYNCHLSAVDGNKVISIHAVTLHNSRDCINLCPAGCKNDPLYGYTLNSISAGDLATLAAEFNCQSNLA